MKLTNEFEPIRKWAHERNIIHGCTELQQLRKVNEEFEEFKFALLFHKHEPCQKHKEDVQDAIGDTIIALTNYCEIQGLKIEDCINYAFNQIKDRKGKIVDGQYIKESDLENK